MISRIPIEKRFWPKVKKSNGCWLWTGAKCNGYGRIGAGGRRGSPLIASRVSWEIHNGPIPENMQVLHKCDNPPCVNPGHLFLGTIKENVEDMCLKGRHVSVVGEANPKTFLTSEQVREIRKRYTPYKTTCRDLAREFKINWQTVRNIVAVKRWKHI